MSSKRKYNIKGTSDYIVMAGICFFMCLWAVKDAWYPSDKVLRKHPREVVVAFETPGTVKTLEVAAGDAVWEDKLLATLRNDRTKSEFEAEKATYATLKKEHALAADQVRVSATPEGEERCALLKEQMKASLSKVNEFRLAMDSLELFSPVKGNVIHVPVVVHGVVKAGESVVIIDPKDHFYAFNKSLAIGAFFFFWVFLVIHILGR